MKKFIVLSFFLLGACQSTQYVVKVNSLAADNELLQKHNNCILWSSSKKDTKSILHNRYKAAIKQILQDNGITITENFAKANCEILFDYGISEPQTITTTTIIPTYGVTGISSSTTTGNMFMQNNGFGNYYGSYSAQTNYNPQYGITGYTPANITKVVYIRYLYADARKKSKGKELGEQLWNVVITSVGSSNDLNLLMPYMSYILADKIKSNSNNIEEYTLSEDDKQLTYYKQLFNPEISTNE